MRFSLSVVAALAAVISCVAAQSPNPFTFPVAGDQLVAGTTEMLKWQPTTGGTVTLKLRSGPWNDLDDGVTIASQVQNSGAYQWSLPDYITRGSYYTIEIISDQDATAVNYTPQIVIESTNTVTSSTIDPTSSATAVSSSGSASATFQTSTRSSATSSAPNAGMTSIDDGNGAVDSNVPRGVGALAVVAGLVAVL